MNDLVYLTPNTEEPFTTSEVIAECAGVKRDTVQKLIQRHEKDLREFGRVGFEIRALQTRGGQQMAKVYHLNEQQEDEDDRGVSPDESQNAFQVLFLAVSLMPEILGIIVYAHRSHLLTVSAAGTCAL